MKIVLDDGALMPERAHETDAGLDLRTPMRVVIRPRGNVTIDTGVHVELPPGSVGLLTSKSGLNVRADLIGTGTIDEGYTGSIHVKLYNMGDCMRILERGDKIIQLVVLPIVRPGLTVVNELPETERGSAGFGSTGR